MKLIKPKTWMGVAFVALSTMLVGGLSPNAKAVVLVYENGPLAGMAFSGGPLTIKISNFDNGTQYPVQAVPVGYSGAPGPGVAAGVAAVDAIPGQTQAGNSFATGMFPGLNGGLEDTWGIARVTNIQDIAGFDLFTPGVKGSEITAMFYGEQDFFVQASTTAIGSNVISGTGFKVDFYQDFPPITGYNPTLGPGGRIDGTNYMNVTDSGPPILSLQSVPGFINTLGEFGGPATEFQATFNPNTLIGNGVAFANVVAGTDMAQFDTNSITDPAAAVNNVAFGTQLFTDIQLNFSATPGNFGWLATSNDPINAAVIPEPSSVLAGLACALPVFGSVFRRRRA